MLLLSLYMKKVQHNFSIYIFQLSYELHAHIQYEGESEAWVSDRGTLPTTGFESVTFRSQAQCPITHRTAKTWFYNIRIRYVEYAVNRLKMQRI